MHDTHEVTGSTPVSPTTSIDVGEHSVKLAETGSTFGDFTVNAKDLFIVETGSFTSSKITAETIQVSATEGISVISNGDGLKLAAQSLNGDIDLVNTGGLVISELSDIKGVQFTSENPSGKISLIANSPLTINAPVNAKGGRILMVASGAEITDDITVNSEVLGSSVNLYAGDSVAIVGSGKIESPIVDLQFGTNFDVTTGKTSPGTSSAKLIFDSTAGFQKINIPSIGLISGKGRITEFSRSGSIFINDYFNALNPFQEEFVNLTGLGVTRFLDSEFVNSLDQDNSDSIEIEE